MGLNINLFVHGVPMGQKIWGPKGDDSMFLSSFYGPKWDMPEVMKVDVMTFGGTTYCYYSFVKGKNVCDANGREGSFLALTLRVNAFYADVQNMYNVLKATYDKMCVGLCVQDNGISTKYLVQDFAGIDPKLKEIEKHLLNYISEFSIGEDIIPLSGFMSSGQGATINFNLHECNKKVALETVKKTGKIVVSPWFLASNAAKVVAQLKADMQATTQKAQQEIKMQQQASQEKIDAITKQSREELRECREEVRKQIAQADKDCQEKIEEIKQSYADVDATIKSMKAQIKAEKATAEEYKENCDKKDQEIARNIARVQKLETQYARLEDDYRQLSNGQPVVPRPRRLNLWLVSGVSFFILLLLGSSILFGVKWHNGMEEIKERDSQIEQMLTENDSLKNELDSLKLGQLGIRSLSESIGDSQDDALEELTPDTKAKDEVSVKKETKQEDQKSNLKSAKDSSEKAKKQDASQTSTKETRKEETPPAKAKGAPES